MADQEGRKKVVIDIGTVTTHVCSLTRSIVVNATGKPTMPAPMFTSSSGAQVNPSAPKQASESASGQAGGNTPEKK